jgi:hypothetical protein
MALNHNYSNEPNKRTGTLIKFRKKSAPLPRLLDLKLNYLYHVLKEGKLLFYAKLKQQFKQETYLNLTNIKHRNAIRDIRMSTHKLQIETGRYINVQKEHRICKVCQMNKIETEEHFILECPVYKEQRSMFSEDIKKQTGLGIEEGGIQAIKGVFELDDLRILNKFGKFLITCWETRRQINDLP